MSVKLQFKIRQIDLSAINIFVLKQFPRSIINRDGQFARKFSSSFIFNFCSPLNWPLFCVINSNGVADNSF